MGKLKLICCFIFLATSFISRSQTDSVINLHEEKFIAGSFTDFYVDNLNNIYLLNADNQIKKLNANGDSVSVSNALKKFGDIYSMDVSNPLKILVYYKDFSTIIVLDRFLKNVNTIDLRLNQILQAQAVALSYDNNYWVFDEVENKLKKIDDNGSILLSTPDLRTVFNESFSPEKVIDNNGYVYLYNKESGCKIFDYYGSLKQSLPALHWNDIQLFKNSIFGFDTNEMHVYKPDIFRETKYLFNPSLTNYLKTQKMLDNLYELQKDGLHIYSMKQ